MIVLKPRKKLIKPDKKDRTCKFIKTDNKFKNIVSPRKMDNNILGNLQDVGRTL